MGLKDDHLVKILLQKIMMNDTLHWLVCLSFLWAV